MMMIMMIMIMKRRMKWRRSFLTNCVFLGLVTHIARQSHHLGQSIHTVLQLDQQIHNSRLVDFHKNWEHFKCQKRSTHGLDHISPVLGEPRDRVHLPAVVDCHLASQILQCHHWKMHLQCLNSTWTSSEVKPDFSASLKECHLGCCVVPIKQPSNQPWSQPNKQPHHHIHLPSIITLIATFVTVIMLMILILMLMIIDQTWAAWQVPSRPSFPAFPRDPPCSWTWPGMGIIIEIVVKITIQNDPTCWTPCWDCWVQSTAWWDLIWFALLLLLFLELSTCCFFPKCFFYH